MRRKKSLYLLMGLLFMTGCQNGSSLGSNASSSSVSTSSVSNNEMSSPSKPFIGKEDGIVTLYSVNDFHGKIEQDSQYNGILALQGGILSSPNYESSSLVLSSGDMWQGGYISGFDKGESTTKLMNEFSFVSMALGNHEFDWGVGQIQHNQEVAEFPFLCANLVETATGKRPSWMKDHVVVESEGHRIGIVGAIGSGLESDIKASALKGYEFTEDLAVLSESYTACVEEGAEVVVLSLHDDADSSYTNSIQESNIGFLGIFGGHSHLFQDETDEEMPYVQGGSDSRGYSYMRIDLNDKKIENIGYSYVDMSMDQKADMSFRKTVEDLIAARQAQPVGYLEGTWDKNKSANLVLTAMFEAAKKYWPDKDYDEDSLMAIHNQGGVRGTFPSSSVAIEITMADVQVVSPFDNEVVILPQREVTRGGLTGNYCYPDRNAMTGKTVDLVVIDYLLSDYSGDMYYSEGSLPLKGVGAEGAIIYDVVAEYIGEHSSQENPLQAEDFL